MFEKFGIEKSNIELIYHKKVIQENHTKENNIQNAFEHEQDISFEISQNGLSDLSATSLTELLRMYTNPLITEFSTDNISLMFGEEEKSRFPVGIFIFDEHLYNTSSYTAFENLAQKIAKKRRKEIVFFRHITGTKSDLIYNKFNIFQH